MKYTILTRALALLILAAAPAALAQAPALVPYQGRVQTGTPPADFNGTGQFKFALIAGTANISVNATATVTRLPNNTLNVFTVTNQGAGYITPPTVTISGGGGSGATATAVLTGDKVTSITLGSPGSGYTSVPTVTLSAPPPRQEQVWVNNGALTTDPVNAVSLPVTNGLYSLLLGDSTIPNMASIPPSVLARPDIRLRVWFNGTQLTPDQRLAPTGYLASETTMFTQGAGWGYQQTNGTVRLATYLDSTSAWMGNRSNHPLHFFTANSSAPMMTVATSGNVGIGTGNIIPTKARLEVAGGVDYTSPGATGILRQQSTDYVQATASSVSIHAERTIVAANYFAVSDARIKHITGRSDSTQDLATLGRIEVTDYTHRDTIAKGTVPVKKVIAQQVEKVFPQAVSRATDVVPDIYKKATLTGGWVQLATDLKPGERVRLIAGKSEGIHEVLEVKEGAFRTAFQPANKEIFVYGREVNDFCSVDYEAIAMLNVSATQELARQLEAEKADTLAKDKEIAALKERLAGLEAKDAARDAKLAALVKLMEDRTGAEKAATVSTVTTQQ